MAELDAEVPHALTSVVEELRLAIERRSMRQRSLFTSSGTLAKLPSVLLPDLSPFDQRL